MTVRNRTYPAAPGYSGELDDPEAGVLSAAVNLLRNAFVAAFSHSIEGTVTIGNVDAREED